MDARQQMQEANLISKADQAAAKERLKEASKKRLAKIIETKMRTTFIGDLSQVEQHLGHMWGHRLRDDQCSPEQLALRPAWEAIRTNILNNGNNQLRAIHSELEQYDVNWNRHQTKLPVVQPAV